ncbi:MAG TPA: hypothetical protein VLS27_14955 [Gammaproteobacteria bacterium]|nr:hypothetical protein [Gammaproteobacteria bacterium]
MASRTISEIQTLVRPFVEICFLRRAPQDLPDSTFLLALMLVAHTVTSILLNAVVLNGWNAMLAGFTDTLLVSILTASVLYLHSFSARIVQTLSAMTGTGAIISLVAIPLFSWHAGAQQSGSANAVGTLMVFGIVVWSLAVSAHILRHALSVAYFLGILVSVAFYGISYTVFSSLFWTGS